MQTASHHWYIKLQILISFFFWIIVSCETFTQPFCKRHYHEIFITKTRHVQYTGTCTCDHYVFGVHGDTCISSLGYIKWKRLGNDIKTKSISKPCTNYETKGKPRKSATLRYRTRMHNKKSVCTERYSTTPNPLGNIVFDIPERNNLYSTSEPEKLVVSKQRREIL